MFVLTFIENGGLNQITLRFRRRRLRGCSAQYSNLSSKPLFLSAASYAGVDRLKTSSFEEISESLRAIPAGFV